MTIECLDCARSFCLYCDEVHCKDHCPTKTVGEMFSEMIGEKVTAIEEPQWKPSDIDVPIDEEVPSFLRRRVWTHEPPTDEEMNYHRKALDDIEGTIGPLLDNQMSITNQWAKMWIAFDKRLMSEVAMLRHELQIIRDAREINETYECPHEWINIELIAPNAPKMKICKDCGEIQDV